MVTVVIRVAVAVSVVVGRENVLVMVVGCLDLFAFTSDFGLIITVAFVVIALLKMVILEAITEVRVVVVLVVMLTVLLVDVLVIVILVVVLVLLLAVVLLVMVLVLMGLPQQLQKVLVRMNRSCWRSKPTHAINLFMNRSRKSIGVSMNRL